MAVLVPDLAEGDGSVRLGLLVGLWMVAGVVLVFRRRWPVPVLALLVAVLLVTHALALSLSVVFLVLVALFTVIVDAGSRATAAGGAGMLLLVELIHIRPWTGGIQLNDFMVTAGVIVAVAAIALYRAARLAAVDQLRERAELLAQRATLVEREQEQQRQLAISRERVRIAAEMHDVVGHHLTVMVTLAEGTLRALPVDGPTAEPIRLVAETGREALTETRRILGVLRTAAEEPGPDGTASVIDRLRTLTATVRSAGVAVDLDGSTTWESLPNDLASELLRVVQEALTNVLKHAGPGTTARVDLQGEGDGLRLTVADDGAGVPTAPAVSSGAGLGGMRTRLAPWAGTVTGEPRAAGGWILTVQTRPTASAGPADGTG